MDGRPKQPNVRICDPTRTGPPEFVPLDPSEQHPILLKLHGDLNYPESIVVTEEDYLVFIQKMSDRHQHPIHQNILARRVHYVILTSSPLEDSTVVGWPTKIIFQPTSGGAPDGPGSRSLL